MALFEVTDPQTGVTLELEGDSAPTEQELIQIFSTVGGQDGVSGNGDSGGLLPSGDVRGGVDFSKATADIQRVNTFDPLSATPAEFRQEEARLAPVSEKIAAGVISGLDEIRRGAIQLGVELSPLKLGLAAKEFASTGDLMGSIRAAESQTSAVGKELAGEPVFAREVAELRQANPLAVGGGELLASAAPGVGLVTKTIKGAATLGAIEEGIRFAETPGERLANITIGSVFGGAADTVSTGIRKIISPKVFDRETGQLTEGGQRSLIEAFGSIDEAKKSLPQLSDRLAELETRDITSADLIELGKSLKVPVLTSDLVNDQSIATRLFLTSAEKVPVLGTGGLRRGQQQGRQALVTQILNDSRENVGSAEIIASLNRKVKAPSIAAGKRHNEITAEMNQIGEVRPNGTMAAIDKQIFRLSRPGALPTKESTAAINELEGLKATLNDNPQNFEMLRENRTRFRGVRDRLSASGQSQFRGSDQAALDSVYNAMTEDMRGLVDVTLGKQALFKYNQADTIYRREGEKLTRSRLKGVLDKGELTPEIVEGLVFSTKKSERASLFASLDKDGRAAVRSSIVSRALQKSTTNGEVNPNLFASQLDKLEPSIKSFFRGAEAKQIQGIQKLLFATKRAQDAAVITPTGQGAIALGQTTLGATALMGNPAAQAFFVAQGASGLGGRFYESKQFRNRMIRLANAKAGSEAEQEILNELAPALVQILGRAASAATTGGREAVELLSGDEQ